MDDGRFLKVSGTNSGGEADGDAELRKAKLGRLFYESKYNTDMLPKIIC